MKVYKVYAAKKVVITARSALERMTALFMMILNGAVNLRYRSDKVIGMKNTDIMRIAEADQSCQLHVRDDADGIKYFLKTGDDRYRLSREQDVLLSDCYFNRNPDYCEANSDYTYTVYKRK